MKIAIVGSRRYENKKKIKDFIFKLKEEYGERTIIVSGGCKDGEVYNIGGECEKRNKDIVWNILYWLSGSTDMIEYVEDRKGHDRRYAMDISKIKKQLGWYPKIPFEQGIRELINESSHNR